MNTLFLVALIAVALIAAVVIVRRSRRQLPPLLSPGKPLPDFAAIDENGDAVRSSELRGRAAVLLFIRGNWCPFCNKQVANLTEYYKQISDLDARLIFVTPKPLETTRRVAEYFGVEFEFWLDDQQQIANRLGLVHTAGVPKKHRAEYGTDTIWPTAVVIDGAGVIRFSEQTKFIVDRPNPEKLLRALQTLSH